MLPLPLRCPAEFIFIYRELGGNVWIRDGRGQTALELADNNSSAPALKYLKQFQGELNDFILHHPFQPYFAEIYHSNAIYKRQKSGILHCYSEIYPLN